MSLEEVLQLADRLVLDQTGKHLSELQEIILRGTWEDKDYQQIAKEAHKSERRTREVGGNLWEILSQGLGKDINKRNFRGRMEKLQIALFSKNNVVLNQDHYSKSKIVFCGDNGQKEYLPNFGQEETTPQPGNNLARSMVHDLRQMPDLGNFYGRDLELESLESLILKKNCPLVALIGLTGIGKTALAVQVVQQIKDEFTYIFWCNLAIDSNWENFQANFQILFKNHQKPRLPLIKLWQKYRCLIVLDNVHLLFHSGELAGQYKPEMEDWRSLFEQVTLSHQSCFLIMGWDLPREITQKHHEKTSAKIIHLTGLDGESSLNILEEFNPNFNLGIYQGHPLCLKNLGTIMQNLGPEINDLFNDHNYRLFPQDLKPGLQRYFNRLSPPEKQIMLKLVDREPLNITQLLESVAITPTQLIAALQSLTRRYLVVKQDKDFILSPMVKWYWENSI